MKSTFALITLALAYMMAFTILMANAEETRESYGTVIGIGMYIFNNNNNQHLYEKLINKIP
jgi:hypothetical protein